MSGLVRAVLLTAVLKIAVLVASADAGDELIRFIYFVPSNVDFNHRVYDAIQKRARLFVNWNREQFEGRAPDFRVDYMGGGSTPGSGMSTTSTRTTRLKTKPTRGGRISRPCRSISRSSKSSVTSPRTRTPRSLSISTSSPRSRTWAQRSTRTHTMGCSRSKSLTRAYLNLPTHYLGLAYWFGYLWGANYEPGPSCMGDGYYTDHCDYTESTKTLVLAKSGRFFDEHMGRNLGVQEPPPTDLHLGDPCGEPTGEKKSCPHRAYCQPWNEWTANCEPTPTKCPYQDVDVDYFGNDIDEVPLDLPEKCCELCAETQGCKAYTFRTIPTRVCYLKNRAGPGKLAPGLVSAILTDA